ncbi:hypothetical protein NP233_g3423 [Leucocoprinus birnbaumii]|uniref:Uncharacterized protein n=1 Tax=Leucocoprinus birnbaumii TaxID=56174 RepID=A0AAD5YSU9_9AGAR|nr:hypothetical protein NP233_g3423 [Leucocoprinus birnbaumii]
MPTALVTSPDVFQLSDVSIIPIDPLSCRRSQARAGSKAAPAASHGVGDSSEAFATHGCLVRDIPSRESVTEVGSSMTITPSPPRRISLSERNIGSLTCDVCLKVDNPSNLQRTTVMVFWATSSGVSVWLVQVLGSGTSRDCILDSALRVDSEDWPTA